MEHNSLKVQQIPLSNGLQISVVDTKQVISATNNKAKYYSDLAQKYKNEAKSYCDTAKYYAEQNSDISYESLNNMKAELLRELYNKQDKGDYALKSDLPAAVSELNNDLCFVDEVQLNTTVSDIENTIDNIKTDIVNNSNLLQNKVDISSLATELEGKADTNLTNLTIEGKNTITNYSMPSSRYVDLVLGASLSYYVAPADGWVYFRRLLGQSWYEVGCYKILDPTKPYDKTNTVYGTKSTGSSATAGIIFLPIKKGDTFTVAYNATGATEMFRFVYAEGEG